MPAGTIGRLAVQGPTGCRYLDDPRQADYVKGGWNYTGDAYLQSPPGGHSSTSARISSGCGRVSTGSSRVGPYDISPPSRT